MSTFISYSYILILINVFITYIVFIDKIGERERSDESTDNENGFNKARRVIRVVPARLGLKAVGKARLFAASAFQN